ncbi:hypothetical protein PENANT_c005G11185 [Penicillium antarcticum]|uniref:Chitinase n=1 Tax=Penicillium antarcticum TaxID=416450 RepID=A0A1V6QER8_9EURO|nr:hypothetical protein PENANT_c005G11185 [Penicillium antarcticum]
MAQAKKLDTLPSLTDRLKLAWESLVSFDNAKTLKPKANFINGKCLGGLFAWALDEGGPGSLGNPNDLGPSDTSMTGANIDGGSD